MQVRITSLGIVVECDTPHLRARIVDGVVELWEPRMPPDHATEARLDAEGYDPTILRRGGCCDPPTQ